jgi:hypothetical protein
LWRERCISVVEMSAIKKHRPEQISVGQDPEHAGNDHEMSHVAIAALAVSAVVLAGLVLIFASRQIHQHPGAVLATILGVPALITLMVVVVRRRREHRHV